MEVIDSFYYHVANGGIKVEIREEGGSLCLEFTTDYHGYPNISASLNTWGGINSEELLRGLGLTFLRSADKVRELYTSKE